MVSIPTKTRTRLLPGQAAVGPEAVSPACARGSECGCAPVCPSLALRAPSIAASPRRRGSAELTVEAVAASFSPPPAYSLQLTAHSCRKAFTLIEMIVVVAIISLLLAISIPVSMGLVNSQKAKATEATLETVKTAIETFQNEKPLRNLQAFVGEYDDRRCWEHFGPLPPTPTARLSFTEPPPAGHLNWYASWPEGNPTPDKVAKTPDGRTKDKFSDNGGLLHNYLGMQLSGYGAPGTVDQVTAAALSYPTSESLLIFLRHYSPQARTIIDRLGSKFVTNQDADGIVLKNGTTQDLFELRDSWGNAVRYTVRRTGVVGGRLYRWELRSPGSDGRFADPGVLMDDGANPNSPPDPFSAQAIDRPGDDVIVSGSIKVEY